MEFQELSLKEEGEIFSYLSVLDGIWTGAEASILNYDIETIYLGRWYKIEQARVLDSVVHHINLIDNFWISFAWKRNKHILLKLLLL